MTRMKRTVMCAIMLGAALMLATPAAAEQAVAATEAEALEKAIDQAIGRIRAEMKDDSFPDVKRIAVLPVFGDHGEYVTTSLEAAVTKSPYDLFTRDDAEIGRLLEEIEWGPKRGDVMDAATIQKFGSIKGVDAILWGKVLSCGLELGGGRARTNISITVADVETTQKWTIGPIEGKAYNVAALTQFWRYPVFAVGAFVGLIILLVILRIIVKTIKHATRPL